MAKANEMYELTFSAAEPAGSHVKVDLSAKILHDGKTTAVKGFYAGNNTYKVRFLPEEAGEYSYEISGVISAKGSVTIDPPDETHHGVVRADGIHLRHSDGTYIAAFGTTVYALAHQDKELTEQTMQTLENGPFNKVRMCLFPKHYLYNRNEPEYFAFPRLKDAAPLTFTDNLGIVQTVQPLDVNHPTFAFWDDFEVKLNRLFAAGIQVDLILFHPYDRWGHSHMKQEDNLTYIDYLLRRFAAYPNLWWSMANEYDLLTDWQPEWWHELDEYISANDPYHHMLSNHNCIPMYDFTRPAVTHVCVQTRAVSRIEEFQKTYHKPVLDDECCYEGNLAQTWGSLSAKELVNRFWKVTVQGGYCTHGEVLLDDDIVTKEQQDAAVLWWAKGGKLKGESPARIGFLRKIVEALPGPIEAYDTPGSLKLNMTKEEADALGDDVSEGVKLFARLSASMSDVDRAINALVNRRYMGHVGDQVYIYYYGDDSCCARVIPELPEGTFKAEIIDVWNMTRTEIPGDVKPGDELRIPATGYIAILCTKK